MTNSTSFLYLMFALFALLSVLVAFITTILLRNTRRTEALKNELFEAKVDSIRHDIERQVYRLNEKMVSTEERWKDVNHLLISSQQQINKYTVDPLGYNENHQSPFLENAGITKNQVQIDKKLVFYLTPFNSDMENLYSTVSATCKTMGLNLARGDEEYKNQKDIFSHILDCIVKARIIIANIDGRNANVFYELGIAHALDKPTILISSDINSVPFDLQSRYILAYSSPLDLDEKLRRAISNLLIEH